MVSKSSSENFTKIALEWNERQEHARIMEMLDEIEGRYHQRSYTYGYCYHWKVRVLSCAQLKEIVERQNHIEIMKLIKKYGEAIITEDKAHIGCTVCGVQKPETAILPEDIQEFIALRNDKEEIDLYLSFFGFGEKGQNVVLDRGNHDELMAYINRHGFLPEQQKRLLQRGNQDEIVLHIERHGLADELLDSIFFDVKNGEVDDFYRFINHHELSVKYKKKMLSTVKSDEFRAYVNRYGLWEETHDNLVSARSYDDVSYYIHRHQYLSPTAEEEFSVKATKEDLIYYLRHKGEPVNINNLLRSLLILYVGDLGCDCEILTEAFLRVCPSNCEFKDVLNKIRTGTRDEILEMISDKTKLFSPFALATLFFRNDMELFDEYLKYRSIYFY